ncbi:MAG: TonB-dependent receptor [candidate division KSB1 bacterium]|nr:TonB-dependent receptor [candidate division KSB1 bacterium]
MRMRTAFIGMLLAAYGLVFAGTTGKIAGVVTDAETGQPLPAVNVVIEGTTMGAATALDGHYVILNVPPGVYTLRASMMGYATVTVTDVRVKIDLTTTQDFKLAPQTLLGQEVVVVAERPVVQVDVAASQKNVTASEITALPVTKVTDAIGLQAGVTSGLGIRGSGSDQAIFMVDGVVLRDERDNRPITGVPLSAVREVSVQVGGFSAEYTNVRSGVVNVVTREGDPKGYSGTLTFKIRPPGPKHFGISPYDRNSYWLRPYLDDAVCWTGTKNGAWDAYTQRQYPEFDGWNKISALTLQDDDPSNDLTPQGAQQVFLWEHRKQGDIKDPDYLFDAGFGGPVPLVGKYLGNLRFFASGRREENQYLIELSRKSILDQSFMLRMSSDINPSMKLSFIGLYGETHAVSSSFSGGTSYFETAEEIAEQMTTGSFTVPTRYYTNIYWSPTSRFYHTATLKWTHVLSPSTFYEVQLKRMGKKYYTRPGRYRNTSKLYEVFPGYYLDERPFGFSEEPIFGIDGVFIMGGPVSVSRDYSRLATYTGRADLVSQVDRRNQVKAGAEFVYDIFDMSFGQYNAYLPEGNTWTRVDQSPYRGTFYVTDKIEFEGFISNLGLVLDYSNPNGNWFDVDAYDRGFFSQQYREERESQYRTKKPETRWTLSPRLAISHPITASSKLYFNYGHYRQMPTSERLYRVQRSAINAVDYLGDPTIALARTVSYELGYDHALGRDYLLHLSAYYKDITDEEYWVRYISFDGKVNYYKLTNNAYEDIRGFEADITKLWGAWLTGDLNYEYRVETSGQFGRAYMYENPADQREYERRNPVQSKPRPRPRFKAYVDLHTPPSYGPEIVGQKVLGDWHLNLVGRWTAGSWFTWNPNNVPGITYNVQWKDYYNVDLKLSKVFPIGKFDVKLFVDIYNLFNIKRFSGLSHVNVFDYNYYMQSLHLPKDVGNALGYLYIPGDDQPGDYRKDGVAFQPMEPVPDMKDVSKLNPQVIYYDLSRQKYFECIGGQWVMVPEPKIKKLLDDKAYIDMPNQTHFTFLNPRSVFFGVTIDFRL